MNRRTFLLSSTAAVAVAALPVPPAIKLTMKSLRRDFVYALPIKAYEYVTIDLDRTPMGVKLRPIFDALWEGDFDRALYRFDELWADETRFCRPMFEAMQHTKRVPVDDFFQMRRDAYPREFALWNRGRLNGPLNSMGCWPDQVPQADKTSTARHIAPGS